MSSYTVKINFEPIGYFSSWLRLGTPISKTPKTVAKFVSCPTKMLKS
ncbi:hypothetical protein [Mycoplasmopsis agalactiae]|nr:hypothetical protein [Mycoplasmopsis agalactiae]